MANKKKKGITEKDIKKFYIQKYKSDMFNLKINKISEIMIHDRNRECVQCKWIDNEIAEIEKVIAKLSD